MAKFIKFVPVGGTTQAPAPVPESTEGQMLKYLQNKYGENPVDQFELMTELNKHQEDNAVLSEKSVRPLSQLFGWYIPDWVKGGFASRVAAKELAPSQPGKLVRMENHIRELEAKLAAANIQYTPFAQAA